MKLGTKTLLFGVHQIIIHPLLVTIAWVKLYNSFPTWREMICIIIHDWGYWGKANLKDEDGDRHPELGAKIAHKLLDKHKQYFYLNSPETDKNQWKNFILGHSSFYIERYGVKHGVKRSKLLAPDKYFHCIIPLWFYKILAVPSGEFKHYRELNHVRQVSNLQASDAEWWANLQKVCYDKIADKYIIDNSKLAL